MNREFINRAPQRALDARARELSKLRSREQDDALDFLVYGDEDGRHSDTCVHSEPCAREYDPLPYREAEPAEPAMYAGTGIGVLYGLPGSDAFAWQLAGWNLVPRSTQ